MCVSVSMHVPVHEGMKGIKCRVPQACELYVCENEARTTQRIKERREEEEPLRCRAPRYISLRSSQGRRTPCQTRNSRQPSDACTHAHRHTHADMHTHEHTRKRNKKDTEARNKKEQDIKVKRQDLKRKLTVLTLARTSRLGFCRPSRSCW